MNDAWCSGPVVPVVMWGRGGLWWQWKLVLEMVLAISGNKWKLVTISGS